ncbi:MinD/ParA family ATP-binding protein [Natrarchaeobaculum aegyptiacum]|uniref:Septum site-determining protein MinD n=1 Tax=Natrarchaeobaculum aegyptiacum TaxID=745377 RepID=A0A2Z2HVB7_9EURY|nr:MinD/ParA family protein [Natrarchaeobaculum aegyptiacum]ARS90115.1 septum site-determining protein MinD [Natrarchaeobaculum aegyptiacum]
MSHETVYAIASGKGGVGKTTTTVNLGTALAQAGERVAIVDTDLGMANLAGFVSLTPDATTLHDVLAGDASIEDATYRLADNIVAVPSGTDLDEYAETSPEGLREAVSDLRTEYDYVFLDVGAGISHETVLPLGLADEVIVVSTPEPASVQDSEKTIELTEHAGGTVAGLVVTRIHPDTDVTYDEIADRLGLSLLGAVPEDGAARESVYAGTPLVVYQPESAAAVAYRRIAADIAGIDTSTSSSNSSSNGADANGAGAQSTGEREQAAPDEVSSAITEAESDH